MTNPTNQPVNPRSPIVFNPKLILVAAALIIIVLGVIYNQVKFRGLADVRRLSPTTTINELEEETPDDQLPCLDPELGPLC